MPHSLRAVYLFPMLAVFLGCASDSDDPLASSEASELPVIASIRSRDHVITVFSGPAGPRYALATTEGNVLEKSMSIEEFELRHPSIYEVYRSSVAGSDASLWAIWSRESPGAGKTFGRATGE